MSRSKERFWSHSVLIFAGPRAGVKMEALGHVSKFKVINKVIKLLSKCNVYSFLGNIPSVLSWEVRFRLRILKLPWATPWINIDSQILRITSVHIDNGTLKATPLFSHILMVFPKSRQVEWEKIMIIAISDYTCQTLA